VELKNEPKYLVAYLDLLGTEKIFEKDINNQTKLINDLLSIYETALGDVKRVSNAVVDCNLKTNIFSDNILIAIDYDENNSEAEQEQLKLQIFLTFVAKIQFISFTRGYLLRGGIDYGDLYINQTFCIGKTLIDTYHIENKVAKYPRIVTNNIKIVEDSKKIQRLNTKFLKDSDGKFFLDFLNFFDNEASKKMAYAKIPNLYNKKFEEDIKGAKQIVEKIEWTINYYNKNCSGLPLQEYRLNTLSVEEEYAK